MNQSPTMKVIQRVFALVAIVFGLVTIVAGSRVLAGTEPGYIVFRPLLFYNVVMGAVYIAAGVAAWRSAAHGKYSAAAIFILNLLVLGAVGYLYASGGAVAMESLRAMTLRTVVWLVLFLGFMWVSHRNNLSKY